MNLSNKMYVPALSWRMAEYQALLRLSKDVKERIVPLITIPNVEFDFEARAPKKTVHDHVEPFVRRYMKKWNSRPAWIRLDGEIAKGRMDDDSHVFDYVFDGLRSGDSVAVPAVPFSADADCITAVARAMDLDGRGVGVVVRLEDMMDPDLETSLLTFVHTLSASLKDTDLIIDLRAPNFEPYKVFSNALISAIYRLENIESFRNLVLLSTAIPNSFKSLTKGSDDIPRLDWLVYKHLISKLSASMRRPIYGDYTIVHPDFEARDMRMVKSSGKVIYATPGAWKTRKGGAFRDDPAQMHGHCSEIVNNQQFQFYGSAFSEGDDYIAKCAIHQAGSSNLTKWKEVGINHHITLASQVLANLGASA